MDADAAIKRLFARYAGNGSTADAIHDAVAEGILSRVLPPGWRLGEERLASLFSVSRTPVREALMRLESESLAARNRRSGLVVADVSAEQILEIYVIREALDGIAARQAAHFSSPVDIAALERLNDALAAASAEGAYERMAGLNVEFHTALARASRNEMLQRFVDQVHQAVRRFQRTTFSEPGRADEAVREHLAIIEAVKKQDERAAEEAARRHMQHALTVRMAMELERD
ncbi:MAG TPA: GntR family transcriptional regulator [Candidatus Limnocylindrales bacterium]|nr:GntR family transcriptional regulator [Candidatus Limnocylindrales bacterium]